MLEIILSFYILLGVAWLFTITTMYSDARYAVSRHEKYPILYNRPVRDEDLARCRFWARMLIATPVWPVVLFILAAKRGRELVCQLFKDAR